MSTNKPTKSSSRAGRFKKKLVSEEFLRQEAPVIESQLQPILDDYHQKLLSPAELVGAYIVMVLSYRYPGVWLGAKNKSPLMDQHQLPYPIKNLFTLFEPNIQKRLASYETLGEVFNHFALKSTPLTVNRSLLKWSMGLYGLELMFRIPSPSEVLKQQIRARRCVTVLIDKMKAASYILQERDALSFTMHDLIHADHFYHDNHCFEGQLGFYGFLNHCMEENHFADYLTNPKFMAEFEYLIADMNAYAIHLFKCLKAALIFYHPQKEVGFGQWLEKLKLESHVKEALVHLNTDHYRSNDDITILQYLRKWQSN
jgi:hypothetical protein